MYKDFVMGSEKNVLSAKVCCDQIQIWNATLDNAVFSLEKKKDNFFFAYYRVHKCRTRPHLERNEFILLLHTVYSRPSLILSCHLRSWYKLFSCLQTSRVKFMHFSFPHINCDTFSHPLDRTMIILITVAEGHKLWCYTLCIPVILLLPVCLLHSKYFLFPDTFNLFISSIFSFCLQWISHALLLSYPILYLHTVAVFYPLSPWQRCNLRPFFSFILFIIKTVHQLSCLVFWPIRSAVTYIVQCLRRNIF
jgi:hypothetical protein